MNCDRNVTFPIRFPWAAVLGLSPLLLTLPSNAQSGLTPDRTLGTESSRVKRQVYSTPTDLIVGGARRDTNLFHSFRDFNVVPGRSVYFYNPRGIQNILTRITGSSPSIIADRLGVLGPANLFLLNPHGILFGPKASLDLKGSFIASTADTFVLNQGIEFSATQPRSLPQLTINTPIGLQYGTQPRPIHVYGPGNGLLLTPTRQTLQAYRPLGLQVAKGQTLALLGGDVTFDGGNAIAPDGRIIVGSVGENALIQLTPDPLGWTADFTGTSTFQNTQLANAAAVDTTGRGGGEIHIQANQLTLSEGSAILNHTLGRTSGAAIAIHATERVSLQGQAPGVFPFFPYFIPYPSSISTDVAFGARGNGGDLKIKTPRLQVTDGAQIYTSSFGFGDAGKLTINTQSIELAGKTPFLASGLQTLTYFTGQGGDLHITTDSLRVTDGAQLTTATFGSGAAGALKIAAASVDLSNSHLLSLASPGALGSPGTIAIATNTLEVTDGALVSVVGFADGGGDLTINAQDVAITTGGTVSVTNPLGPIGQLSINSELLLLDQGQISTVTGQSDPLASPPLTSPNNIELTINQRVSLFNESLISADALNTADGGTILIDTPILLADQPAGPNGSDIVANAMDGQGGTITLRTEERIGIEPRDQLTPLNDITASSSTTLPSQLIFQTSEIDPSTNLAFLPVQSSEIKVAQTCAGSGQPDQNTFMITGRGGLPPTVQESLELGAVQIDLATLEPPSTPVASRRASPQQRSLPSESQSMPHPPIQEARGWNVNPTGQLMLMAAAPVSLPPPACRR